MSLYTPNILDGVKVVIDKQIVFQSNSLDINYYVNQKCINATIFDFKPLTYPLDVLQVIENIKLFEKKQICQGGPSVINYPGIYLKTIINYKDLLIITMNILWCHIINYCLGIHIKNTHLENGTWFHNNCAVLTNAKKRCERCNLLFPYFRMTKKRKLMKNTKYIGSILTPTRRSMFNKLLIKSKNIKKSNLR